MSGLRRVLLPSKEIASRRWARWEMFDEHGERVGWVTEGPRGGQNLLTPPALPPAPIDPAHAAQCAAG